VIGRAYEYLSSNSADDAGAKAGILTPPEAWTQSFASWSRDRYTITIRRAAAEECFSFGRLLREKVITRRARGIRAGATGNAAIRQDQLLFCTARGKYPSRTQHDHISCIHKNGAVEKFSPFSRIFVL